MTCLNSVIIKYSTRKFKKTLSSGRNIIYPILTPDGKAIDSLNLDIYKRKLISHCLFAIIWQIEYNADLAIVFEYVNSQLVIE